MPKPNLSTYDNSWYSPGRGGLTRTLWFFLGLPILRSRLLPSSSIRSFVLRLFGAKVGLGIVLKPGIRVKYPWLLSIGDHSWIGEDVWIDNLTTVAIGANACISQGAYLCTGSHDLSDPSFGLLVHTITIEEGAWVGARAVICPGVTVAQCAVVAAGSVVTKDVPANEIHAGNPARFLKVREIRHAGGPADKLLK